jgi:hypothetical protein
MDDKQIEQTFQFLVREVLRLNENAMHFRASVYVLKMTVAGLTGEDPKEVLAQFQKAEEKVLASDQTSVKLKEALEVLDLWKKHPPNQNPDS